MITTVWVSGNTVLIGTAMVQAIAAVVIAALTVVNVIYMRRTIAANSELVEHTRRMTEANMRMVDDAEKNPKAIRASGR
jgi:hypothetical protein